MAKVVLKNQNDYNKIFKIAIRNFMRSFDFWCLSIKYPNLSFDKIFNHIYENHYDKIRAFCYAFAKEYIRPTIYIVTSEKDTEKTIALKILKVLWNERETQKMFLQGKTVAINIDGLKQFNFNLDKIFHEIEKRHFNVDVLFKNNIGIKRKSKFEGRIQH